MVGSSRAARCAGNQSLPPSTRLSPGTAGCDALGLDSAQTIAAQALAEDECKRARIGRTSSWQGEIERLATRVANCPNDGDGSGLDVDRQDEVDLVGAFD